MGFTTPQIEDVQEEIKEPLDMHVHTQVAEAKVIKRRVPQGGWQVGCLAPKVKMLQVCMWWRSLVC